jgi:F420-dependent methylenetetrahydromethanopterin dehydrogenase
MLRTSAGIAPRAIRMPISCVRCWTEYDMSPYIPIIASTSAMLAKIVSRRMSSQARERPGKYLTQQRPDDAH